MPFLKQDNREFPTKDLLSWYFDEQRIDENEPLYIDAADPSNHYTQKTAKESICKIAAGLKAIGIKKGDTICVHSFNSIHYPILVNGIVAAGAIFSGTNPGYTSYELSHAVKVAKVTAFIVEPELLTHVQTAAQATNIPNSKILIFDTGLPGQSVPTGFKSWRTLFNYGSTDWERFDDLETAKNTEVARLFSSGTTGLPKAAMLSHYNLIAQEMMAVEYAPKPYRPIQLIPLPLFHVSVAPCVHFSPLRSGLKTYLMRRFDLEPFLANMERFGITELSVVPPIVIAIIMSPASKKYSLKGVKQAKCGAAPLGKETQLKLQALLQPGVPFTQVWGMTELTCIATMLPYPESDITGSVGRPNPGLDVKLVDENGKDITAYDIRGEMCVRGPSVIKGYLDNPEANKDWDEDGYFHTGDIMYCDGKTKLWYIVDRRKELIKVRGFQVAPPELETVLLDHPQIIDAAVIGVKSREGDVELPRGYVVRRPGPEGDKLTADDVHKHVNQRLIHYKRLTGGVVFVNEIPKNASGKILKRFLRERAEKEMSAKL